MKYVKPIDPYTLLETDDPYRDRQNGVKGSAIQTAAITHPMRELLHLIEFSGQTPDGDDLEQVRKAIQRIIRGSMPDDTSLTAEQVQDIVAEFINAAGASVVYDDAGNALSINISNASSTRRGIVERATDDEASIGTDNARYITPRHLKIGLDKKANASHQHSSGELGFRHHNSSNGYQKFPNGLIYQWGQFRATFDQSGTRVVFPIAFPSSCYNVITSVHRSTRQVGGITTYTESFSRTGCRIVGNLYSAKYGFPKGYIHWHAIGR